MDITDDPHLTRYALENNPMSEVIRAVGNMDKGGECSEFTLFVQADDTVSSRDPQSGNADKGASICTSSLINAAGTTDCLTLQHQNGSDQPSDASEVRHQDQTNQSPVPSESPLKGAGSSLYSCSQGCAQCEVGYRVTYSSPAALTSHGLAGGSAYHGTQQLYQDPQYQAERENCLCSHTSNGTSYYSQLYHPGTCTHPTDEEKHVPTDTRYDLSSPSYQAYYTPSDLSCSSVCASPYRTTDASFTHFSTSPSSATTPEGVSAYRQSNEVTAPNVEKLHSHQPGNKIGSTGVQDDTTRGGREIVVTEKAQPSAQLYNSNANGGSDEPQPDEATSGGGGCNASRFYDTEQARNAATQREPHSIQTCPHFCNQASSNSFQHCHYSDPPSYTYSTNVTQYHTYPATLESTYPYSSALNLAANGVSAHDGRSDVEDKMSKRTRLTPEQQQPLEVRSSFMSSNESRSHSAHGMVPLTGCLLTEFGHTAATIAKGPCSQERIVREGSMAW